MKLPSALPHLEGARGTMVRALFAVLLVLTAVQIAGSTWINARDLFVNVPSDMAFGFRTFSDTKSGKNNPIIGQTATEEARGIARNSTLVSIDGDALGPGDTEFTIGQRLHDDPDGKVMLVTRAPDGAVSSHQFTRASPWGRIDPFSGLPVWFYSSYTLLAMQLPLLLLFAAALILVRRRPRDPEAMLAALSMLAWCFNPNTGFWLILYLGAPPLLFSKLLNCAVFLTFVTVAGFPDGRFASRLARVTLVATIAFFAYVLAIDDVVAMPQWTETPLNLTGIGIALMSVATLWRRYHASATDGERQQIKWAVFGFIAGILCLVGIVALNVAISGGGHGPLAYVVINLLVAGTQVCGALGLLVSLTRYRLYDAEAAISRSVAYGALTLALIAIFAGSEKVLEILGEEYFGESLGVLAGGMGAAIAAAMIAPLHHRVSHWAEHRFQKALIRLRHGLPLLVGDMRETASLGELAEAVLRRCERGVRARGGAFVVAGKLVRADAVSTAEAEQWLAAWHAPEGEALDCDRADPLFPMRVPLSADGIGRVGWLLLGPRPDGSFYGKDEREALAEIADPVARAVAIVRRREALAVEVEGRFAAIESAIARLKGNNRTLAVE